MRAHASRIQWLLTRSLPLALALAWLATLLGGVVAPHWQIAHAASPSITIVSPTTANGPVQTGIQIDGAGWNPGASVQVFYSAPSNNNACGDPSNSQTLAQQNAIPGVGTQTPGADGTWKVDFQWPSNTGTGTFYICGFDSTTPMQVTPSDQPFQVLSTNLPSITLSNAFPNVGDQITITGSGFLPGNQPIDLALTQPGGNAQQGTGLGTVQADINGGFTQQVTLPASPSGALSVVAVSRTPVSGALPPLTASTSITIGAAPSTPTPTPQGSVTPSPTATTVTQTAPTTTPTSSSKSGLILVLLVVALVLVILAIFGVLIWYVAGTRPPAGAAAAPRATPPPGRARAPVAPRRAQNSGWQSLPDWQQEDEWEDQQGPWEEDEQGGWSDVPTQWDDGRGSRPQQQSGPMGPGTPPSWGGPAGRGNAGAQRPTPPRGPNRDDWPGRGGPGQDGW